MRKKCFTLVELLIVIVIIGILATFVVLALNGTTKSAKDARAKTSIKTVRDSLMQYVAANYNAVLDDDFGTGIIEVEKTSGFNDQLRAGGASALSTDPLDAKGNNVKVKFTDYGYRIEAKTASYDGSGNKTCWYVNQENYKTATNTETGDNLTLKSSATDCTL